MLLLCLYKHFIHDVLFTELEHIFRHLIEFVQCLRPEFVTFTLPQHFTCVTSVELLQDGVTYKYTPYVYKETKQDSILNLI